MKKPKADQEDDAASSSDEENKDAPDVATTLSLDQLPEDIKTAISTAQVKLESGELQEAKDALGLIKSILQDAARFDATSPVDLSYERLLYNKQNIYVKEASPFKQCQVTCLPQDKAGSMD